MKRALDFIAQVGEGTVRAVHAGHVTRSALKKMAVEMGYGPASGQQAHRLIRAHDNVEAFVAFYCHGHGWAEDGASSVAVQGNVADLTVLYPHGPPITDLDALKERFNLDLDPEEWDLVRPGINVYSGQMKVGPKGAERLVYTQLFQMKPRWQRKRLRPSFEIPEPVEIDASRITVRPAEPVEGDYPAHFETALVIPDRHYGYRRDERTGALIPLHDRRAIDLVIQTAQMVEVDRVVDLGDRFDFPAISRYLGTPDLNRTLQPALCEAAYDDARIRAACEPEAEDWVEGNHDKRIRDALLEAVPELYGLRDVEGVREDAPPHLSLPALLNLDRHGVRFHEGYPDAEVEINDGLIARHGTTAKGRSGQTVYTVLREQTAEYSSIQGHIHRSETAWFTNWRGTRKALFFATALGCLCHLDGRVEGVKSRQNWQQSFMLIHYDPEGWYHVPEWVDIYPSRSEPGRLECYVRGKRLRSRTPDLEQLSEATNWTYQ